MAKFDKIAVLEQNRFRQVWFLYFITKMWK